MRYIGYALTLSLVLVFSSSFQATSLPAIHAPQVGQAVQGVVPIIGTTAVEGFQNAELSFAYYTNPTDTWFMLVQSETPIENEVLTEWDTTTISDGDYTLRLIVRLDDGRELKTSVERVRVRNYTVIETDTPTPTMPTSTPAPSVTPAPSSTPTITPTQTRTPPPIIITPLPANPAQLSDRVVLTNIGFGVLIALGCLTLYSIYLGMRSLFRRG